MRFAELSRLARLYLASVYACAVAALAGLWVSSHGAAAAESWPWPLFAILTLAAAVAHSFPVSTPERQSYHVSTPFFLAAILLLQPLQVAALVAIVHLAEWARRRRSWFSQLFNAAAYVITALAAQSTFFRLCPANSGASAVSLDNPACLIAGLVTVATFLALNHGLVMLAIWLGNGIPPRAQRVEPDVLFTEALLLALGIPLAHLASVAPWGLALGTAPLVLIHRALDAPNIRAQRRQDAFTHLYNTPTLIEACSRELQRADRFGRPLALMVLDIDGLGKVNAAYGRQAGDAVIQGIAALLARLTRGYDVAARVVGGEFAVLLPDIHVEHVETIAQRICRAIAAQRLDVPSSLDPVSVSVSVGVAVASGNGVVPDRLFASAEAAMSQAKRVGGGTVRLAVGEAMDVASSEEAHQRTGLMTIADNPAAAAAAGASMHRTADNAAPAPAAATAQDVAVADVGQPARGERVVTAPTSLSGPNREWRAKALSLLLAAIAGAVALRLAPDISNLDPVAIVMLVGLIVLADLRGFELTAGSSNSISVVPLLTIGMLSGPAGAVVVAPVSAIVRGFYRRSRWYKVLFNVSLYVIAASSGAAVFSSVAPPLEPKNMLLLLPAAALAGLTYYLLNSGAVAIAVATEAGTDPRRVWHEEFRWLWSHYLVLGSLALLLAVAYHEFGIPGAAAFVVPPLMMHFVAKQYMDKTTANVRQLRVLNEQLQTEIAQRKVTEEENVRLTEAAARAAALEELNRLKSEFISVASHELRTPMTAIMGFSELLLEDTAEADPNREALNIIHEEAVQLSALVDNLLNVSRIENGRITVDPASIDLMDTVLPPLVHALGSSAPTHCLVTDIAPDARWVEADPSKLNQIFTNLVGNAIKYSPQGGRIDIAARRQESGLVEIAVIDHGIGIPAEHFDRIFDRFYRVDSSETRSIGGTGLGLYITRHLVELHGGMLTVESQLGQGSTFRFTLPAAHRVPETEQAADAVPESAPPEPAPAFRPALAS